MRVQEVLDKLMEPVGTIENTVDTLKSGSAEMEVTGIGVTFMATQHCIRQAVEQGLNLIISHESAFYSHWDKMQAEDSVYVEKQKLIEDSGIAVFRFHDYCHRYQPDAITRGLAEALEWESYITAEQSASTILSIPERSVKDIAEYTKSKLGIDYVRVTGDLSMPCSKIGLLVGYRGGGALAIPLMDKENLDLIICGEGPEWEMPEYVRDAVSQGKKKAAVVLGHAESEVPGMRYLAHSIQEMFPGTPVKFLEDSPIFKVI